jgi:hypothetical protein
MAQQTWTDTLPTVAKATHIQELMDAIKAYETAYSQTGTTFTNDPVGGNITIQHKTNISEMKSAIDTLRTAVDSGAFSWTGDYTNAKLLDDAEIVEIRTNINWLQDGNCIECHTCDTYGCSTCDGVCNAEACATCDSTCYLQTCSCNNTCYTYTCASCNNVCYYYTCSSECSKGNCGSEG